ATPDVSATPRPTPFACGTAPATPAGNVIRIEPYCTGVVKDGGFAVKVKLKSTVPSGGITVAILFDRTVIQVVSITKSTAFAGAFLFQGAGQSSINDANGSGKINQVAAAFFAPSNLPAGEAEFVTIEFKAIACGKSDLTILPENADSTILDG